MFNRNKAWYRMLSAVVGLLTVFLTVLYPAVSFADEGGGYSGDDAYDPAAGGEPEKSLITRLQGSTSSAASTYSGDDAYDPAAGGQPETSLIAANQRSTPIAASSYSGEDAYDPAAGGTPELRAATLSAADASSVDCGLSADEISGRSALQVSGGFSGDDAYDPAAGGMPELSLLPFAENPGLLAACTPALSGN